MSVTRSLASSLALLLSTSILVACAEQPRANLRESDSGSITVSADPNKLEQQALGEVYTNAFIRHGRESYLEVESGNRSRLQRIEERRVELIIGCTGELLNAMNPEQAKELSAQYVKEKNESKADPNSDKWRDQIYIAMVGNLPSELSATDPSNGTGCEDYTGPELPQNIVPVFRENALTRKDRETLNNVSGGLSKAELSKLYNGPRDSASMAGRANELLSDIGF